ncbi:NPCBM/NEW2 domain-containing protein [Paenibacillus sp. IITD108]|uniref:NPCBM/NEW2 domain-containing protein n=1 Tax=Paenibacillus sp. IITD108 TaxID=3116649 RepID=UPI002F420824
MKRFNLKSATIGFIAGAVFFSGVSFAATSSTIQVSFDKVNFWINGVNKTVPSGKYNNNGTEVPASFMYKGTNYLPMRMVAEMLGKEVNWDGKTSSVYVGSTKGDGVYLSDLNPTGISYPYPGDKIVVNPTMKLGGQLYTNGIFFNRVTTDIEYALDSKYKKFSGIVGLDDSGNKNTTVVTFLGDGNELATYTLLAGSKPSEFNVDVTGVLSLKISISVPGDRKNNANVGYSVVDIVNPFLLK